MKIQNGQIYLEDVPVTLIAQTYGTPTYVYEENRIRDNFRRALNAFRKYYPNFRFFYAIKANNNLAVANILRQEGAGIDAVWYCIDSSTDKLDTGSIDMMNLAIKNLKNVPVFVALTKAVSEEKADTALLSNWK